MQNRKGTGKKKIKKKILFLKNSHVVLTAVKFNLVAVSFLIYSTLKQSTLHLNLSFTMLGVIQEAVIDVYTHVIFFTYVPFRNFGF